MSAASPRCVRRLTATTLTRQRLWISSVWIPVSASLALPFARFGDLMGRRYIWIFANVIGALGNFLVAGGNSVGMVITGVALWSVCASGIDLTA